jgi:hypothetical protein
MNNPYEPPRANLQMRDDRPGLLPKAVAIGVLIDIGGTLAMGFGAAIVYGVVLGLRGYSEEAITKTFESFELWSAFGIVNLLLGTLASVVAGFYCARIANRNTYLAPGILAMISCAFGAALGAENYSQLELLLLSALTVVAVLAGAALYVTRMRSAPRV